MLIINNLSVSVNKYYILKNINLQINNGEIHALMGPNGSGKSTLSLVIAGRHGYYLDGSIFFYGKNIINLSPEDRAHLGIFLSFQNPIEITGVSMINFIKYAVNYLYKAKCMIAPTYFNTIRKVREKINLLKMDKNLIYRYLNTSFSGGERKKNEILQMDMLSPKLSILDEIDSGLDIDSIRLVSNRINDIRKQNNGAILIITHYYRILEYIIPDYIHIIYKGIIKKSGQKDLAKYIEKNGYDWIKR
jgi:Fe-S cluster assembly ATP-binding protein